MDEVEEGRVNVYNILKIVQVQFLANLLWLKSI